MKTLFATGLAFVAMASVSLAQQPPAPPTVSPPAQVQPSAPLAAVPEVMNAPGDAPPAPRHDTPPPGQGPGDFARRSHDGHRPPPPPPSKAAHLRIEDGSTKIDIKCADDEPTKVCSDVLLQILDKLAPPTDSSDDGRD